MRARAFNALLIVLVFLAGSGLSRWIFPRVETRVEYEYVQVTGDAMKQVEPNTEVTIADRITKTRKPPTQVAVAPQAGREDVEAFLGMKLPEPRLEAVSSIEIVHPVVRDSTRIMESPKLIQSIVYRDKRLDLFTLTREGDKVRFTYEGIRDPFEVTMDGGVPWVQSNRFGVLHEIRDHAVVGGIMLGVGVVLGVVLAN